MVSRGRFRFRHAGMVAVLAGFAGACSLALDFDPQDGQPCETECRGSLVCQFGACVEASSVDEGGLCQVDAVCGDGLTCVVATGYFQCEAPCDQFYTSTSCSAAELCQSFHTPDGQVELACADRLEVDCAGDDDCSAEDGEPDPVCVNINGGLSQCMRGCALQASPFVSLNCSNANGGDDGFACEMLGVPLRPACVPVAYGAEGGEGDACELPGNPCAQPFTCFEGECRKFCSTSDSGACGGGTCTSFESDGDYADLGYCSD